MPKMAFELMTIGATDTPQPLVGTKITPAIIPSAAAQTVTVGDSKMYAPKDLVMIDTGSSFEQVQLIDVPSNTSIKAIFTKAHLAGAFTALFLKITSLYIQPTAGGTAPMKIYYCPQQFSVLDAFGRNSLTPSASTLALCYMIVQQSAALNQPVDSSASNIYGANDDNLCFYWISGANPDTYLPSCDVT